MKVLLNPFTTVLKQIPFSAMNKKNHDTVIRVTKNITLMKTYRKLLAALALVVGGLFTANAQIADDALGVRLNGYDDFGIGPEISWQHALDVNRRMELDLGFRSSPYLNSAKFTGLHHWVFNIEGGFNWFVGLGAGLGYVDYDRNGPWYDDDPNGPENLILSGAGDIGFEYNFPFPMQLAIDLRPEAYFLPSYYQGFEPNLGISVRYLFR